MKKTTSISILALCASLMLSCSLDKMPVDRLTAEAVFEDSESFLLWMNECYTMFEGQKVILTDADDFIDADPCEAVCGERSPYTESWDWSMLHHINYLLEHVKECTDADIAREAAAEARFFRGMFYFEMARKYGALPYITNTIGMQNKELMYANPIPQDYVIDAALIDLQDAADSLSADLSPIPAKINRWVALGYMARAALYEGTLLKYQGEAKEDYEEYLQQAADACREIIASGKFSVYKASGWTDQDAYRNLFTMETIPSSEALLLQLFDAKNIAFEVPSDIISEKTGATRRFINHYQLADGKSVSTRSGWVNAGFLTEYAGRDPRLTQTILFPGCKELSDNSDIRNNMNSLTGYQPVKFRRYADGRSYNACFPIMRYPEILLMYAEAKAELGTLTQEDVDNTVNLIRARVGMPEVSMAAANAIPDALMKEYYPNVKGKNQGIILEIRRERTIELALEGHRLWDMLRWHEGAQLGNNKNPIYGIYVSGTGPIDLSGNGSPDFEIYTTAPTQTLVPAFKLGTEIFLSNDSFGYVTPYAKRHLPEDPWDEDCDYLWPIPASELAIPGSKLTQNSGYYY